MSLDIMKVFTSRIQFCNSLNDIFAFKVTRFAKSGYLQFLIYNFFYLILDLLLDKSITSKLLEAV